MALDSAAEMSAAVWRAQPDTSATQSAEASVPPSDAEDEYWDEPSASASCAEEADEADEPEEAEEAAPARSTADPRSDTAFLLPSLFLGRPDTLWLDYPQWMGIARQEGHATLHELTEKRLRPLWFKSDRNINCITNAFKRSGFRRLLKGANFNVYWGHHLQEKQFRMLGPHQWVNHFPGSYGLGRKDNLWKNMSRMLRQHGPAYNFTAKSYLLPRDREYLERDFEEGEVSAARLRPPWPAPSRACPLQSPPGPAPSATRSRALLACSAQVYIVKPPASAEGRGIRLINKLEQLPKSGSTSQLLVQRHAPHMVEAACSVPNPSPVPSPDSGCGPVSRYIGEPYLVNKRKFDIRLYVAVRPRAEPAPGPQHAHPPQLLAC